MIDLLNRILNDPAGLTATIYLAGILTGVLASIFVNCLRENHWRSRVQWRDGYDPCDERKD